MRAGALDKSIFRFILRYSLRQQVLILMLTALSFPFLYATLELPKIIINRALGEPGPREVMGHTLDQLDYLWLLCGVFLALVLVNGAFKYVLNVYAGITGERMLRRLRYLLYGQVLRFPLPHFRRVSQGELIQMINAETEPLGGFIGESISVPAFQGGTLLTILAFMFIQDPVLGFAAVFLYPLQVYIIPKLQWQVNQLGKQRVRQVRRLSEKLGETISGVRDIRANDASQWERALVSHRLGVIFNIRLKIFRKKFFIKFLNNFLAQLGPFFFFSIGGYLVITGQLTLGALVAVIGAHEKLYSPWKELLSYYQLMSDSRIKYEQVVSQFEPPGTLDESMQIAEPEDDRPLTGTLKVAGATFTTEDGEVVLDATTFETGLPGHVAIVGPTGNGKEELTLALANLLRLDSGRILIDGRDLQKLPESVTGRRIGYVGYPAQVFAGSIADNVLFGLKHRPLRARALAHDHELREARLSGNSPFDPEAEWIDLAAAGASSHDDLAQIVIDVLRLVGLEREVYQLGLRGSIDAAAQPELAERILEARRVMRERLDADERLGRLVEVFDPDRYIQNATLAENLLFGAPLDETFDLEGLAAHPYVRRILDEVGLADDLLQIGYKLATTMVELFADLPPDHEYFRQFSFIQPDDLPDYRALIGRADPQRLDRLGEADRDRLLTICFKLIPARHRLGLIDEALERRVVEARRRFHERLPEDLAGRLARFDARRYNPGSSLQDNILFGKIAYGQAQAAQIVSEEVTRLLEDLDLRHRVIEVGLTYQIGIGGARLSLPQRQKLALARALIKRPDILILYEATAPLDPGEQLAIMDMILERLRDRSVIWALQRSDWAGRFGHLLVMRHGRIVEEGCFEELDHDGSALRELIRAA
jgi:putative ABC transport system ATP-binding protein